MHASPAPLPDRKQPPGRPKDPTKRAAILAAAKQMFVHQGFNGASMDDIATAAGVSKLTVYSHFGDKQGLFTQVVQAFCEQALPVALFELAPEQPLRERLLQIGLAFHGMVMAPEAIAGYRILCQPNALGAGFADAFWQAGPQRIQQAFVALLQRRADAGELQLDDPERAASQLITLLKGEPHAQALFGFPCAAPAESPQAHVAAVVDLFLRAHAVR